MINHQLSRRTLLRGLGTAIALPWLEAMSPIAVQASAAGTASTLSAGSPPTRLAFLYVPNGMHMPDWKPRGLGEREFELRSIMQPVANFRDKMNIFTGLSLRGAEALGDGGGDHARSVAAFLTGAHPKKTHGANIRNGISVDQVAARKIGHLTKLRSLELGTETSAIGGRCDSGYSCLYTSNISWRNESTPLPKENNPASVFERLFGSENEHENRAAFAKRQQRRKSILDFVNQEAKRLNQQLGVHDRRKLDEYLYAVRDIERRLKSVDKLETPEKDISNFPRPIGVPHQYSEHVKLLFDMLVLAFQTDSTRVCSFMYANAGSNRSYRNLGISEGHHSISHHGGARAKQQQISKINQYHMGLTNYLLTKLDSIAEGDGTLLDHCLVLHGSGIADGNSHAHRDLPIAMFGSGGQSLDTGRLIRCRVGTPLTNLYRSMLDIGGAHVDEFSDSTGLLAELEN